MRDAVLEEISIVVFHLRVRACIEFFSNFVPWLRTGRGTLNVRQMAELAGLLSVHALQIVESPSDLSCDDLENLRAVSQRRSEAWVLRMNHLTMGSPCWRSLRREGIDARCPLIEEILVSEILTRILAGVLTAKGHHHGEARSSRDGLELFNEHQEARQMALLHMLDMADAEIPGGPNIGSACAAWPSVGPIFFWGHWSACLPSGLWCSISPGLGNTAKASCRICVRPPGAACSRRG